MTDSTGNNNSSNQAANKPANKNTRYKKNNRYKGNKNKPKSASTATGEKQTPKPNPNANPNAKKNNSRNRRPKTLTPIRIHQKYDNLLEQHLIARKKFYEMHGRLTGKQLEKVKFNYHKTMKALYEYEKTLPKEWQKDVLKTKLDLYPADRQFTTTHEIEPVGELEEVDPSFDIHLTSVQTSHEWGLDKEESSGTIDDYKAYKGITD